LLGPGTHFKGVLSFEGLVRIDGKFDGEVASGGTLIVGEGSTVKANVRVKRVVVAGQIHGDIEAMESCEVQPTGRIFGDISTPELQLARGVTLEGKCVINRRPDGSMAVNIGGAASPASKAPQQLARDGNTLRVAQKVG
jgi:cytoskeletal protein CcmA (bactofilin family)